MPRNEASVRSVMRNDGNQFYRLQKTFKRSPQIPAYWQAGLLRWDDRSRYDSRLLEVHKERLCCQHRRMASLSISDGEGRGEVLSSQHDGQTTKPKALR